MNSAFTPSATLRSWPENEMTRLFGENGRDLWRHAQGIDNRPIVTEYETKSISQETTFNVDIRDDKTLEKTIREQSKEVARQLRKSDLAGKTVKLKIRWPDFTTITRQVTLPTSTDNDDEIIKSRLEIIAHSPQTKSSCETDRSRRQRNRCSSTPTQLVGRRKREIP